MKDQHPPSRSKSGFNRRAFLRGSGAAAAATALTNATGLAEGAEQETKIYKGLQPIKLKVNGKEHAVHVEPRMSLLEVLRNQLNLTGAKPVSVDGSSGASSVWVDGKLASANTVLALDCVGHEVTTVESLGGDKPDAVPLAFVKHDAMQCGFCTPGFVVAVRDFMNKHPQATEEEIRSGLNGNLCRCGTYANVIMAATEVVKGGKHG